MVHQFRFASTRHQRLVVALLAATVGSCTGVPGSLDSTEPPPHATSTRTSELATTTTEPWPTSIGPATGVTSPAVDAVLAAYTGMWATTAVAAENPGASHRIAEHATGVALRTLARQLLLDQRLGHHSTGRPVSTPRVLVLIPPAAPTKARVRDCLDTTTWITRRRDGQPAPGVATGRRQVDALVKITDGRWRVTEFVLNGVGTC